MGKVEILDLRIAATRDGPSVPTSRLNGSKATVRRPSFPIAKVQADSGYIMTSKIPAHENAQSSVLLEMKRITVKTVAVVAVAIGVVSATRRFTSRRSKTKMTEKLKGHLILCERAVQSAKPILAKHGFPTDSRTLAVIGFISVLIEHQESILLLVMHSYAGSATALFRPIVEGAYRALWINLPATDADVTKFIGKDKIDLDFGDIAARLDDAYRTGDFFRDFKARAWKHLNSYTHGGMHQIGRRFVKNEVANNYSEGEIYEMTTSVTTIVLLTASLFLKKHGHVDSGDQIQAMMETYGPLVAGPKPMNG